MSEASGQAKFLEDGLRQAFDCLGTIWDVTHYKQVEETLRQREAELRLVTNAVPALISFVDSEQRYRFNNETYETWFGNSPAEVYGKHVREVLGEAAYAELRPHIEQVLAGQEVTFESQVPYKEGGMRYVSATCVPRFNSEGDVEGYVALVSDISERKRDEAERKRAEAALRESESRFRILTSHAPVGIFMTDVEGNCLYVNDRWCKMAGMSPEAAQGQGWLSALHPDDREWVAAAWYEAAESTQTFEAEYRFQTPQGAVTWLQGSATALQRDTGEITGYLGTLTDITDRKRLEAEQERILQLEQAARERAEQANRMKDEFLAVLSHELRSPLNPILGWSRLLQNGKLDDTKTAQALATIERNAKLQAELIEDLLDVSRILQGKLSLNVVSVDLVATVQAAIETVRLAAEAKSIQIEPLLEPEGVRVVGDAARLQQVIWNLLSNAVKFTPVGGRVEIALARVERGKKERHGASRLSFDAQITVSDTGKGIPADFLPHVFDYFRQADATTTRRSGGLGLGLAIVHHLVELHGGTIQAESPGEGQGARFTVTLSLPPSPPKADQTPLSSLSSADLSGVHVLVVDDDADTREFMAFLLEQFGASVAIAAGASEALVALMRSKPAVLVSDIGMPNTDGYMLIQQIRALPPDQGGQIPAIALTAYAGEINYQQAMAAGFQRHVSKPVEPEVLVRTIADLAQSVGGQSSP
ncbi:PAS domain S-box protein [Phormidium tenue FACHB-886]|nr:PAS domain S-box protein [Phormidium tenue FACHB-886]